MVHTNGQTVQYLYDDPSALTYKAGIERIDIEKNSCTKSDLKNFWSRHKQFFSKAHKKKRSPGWPSLKLGRQVRFLQPNSDNHRKLLELRTRFLVLKGSLFRCLRQPSSELVEVFEVAIREGLKRKLKTTKTRQCVEELCPNSSVGYANQVDEALGLDISNDRFYQMGIKTLLNREGVDAARNSIDRSNQMLEWLKSGGEVISNRKAVRVLNVLVAITDLQKFEVKEASGALNVDEEASRRKLSGLSDKDYLARKNSVQFILDYASGKYGEIRPLSTTDPATLQIRYRPEALEKKIQGILTDHSNIVARLKNSPEFKVLMEQPYYLELFDTTRLQRILATNRFTSEDLFAVNNSFNNLKMLDVLLTQSRNMGSLDRDYDVTKIPDFAKTKSYIRETAKKASDRLKAYTSGTYRNETCETSYRLGQGVLPSREQLSLWNRKKNDLKRKFLDQVKTRISTVSGQRLDQLAAHWYLVPPLSKEAHRSQLLKRLQSIRERNHKERESTKQLEKSKDRDFLLALAIQLNASHRAEESDQISGEEGSNELKKIQEACRKMLPQVVPDKTSIRTGGIVVGPQSITQGTLGDGVVYHELGHNLSAYLGGLSSSKKSRAWRREVGQCLRSMHKTSGAQFEEEDFADLMPVLIDKTLGNPECIYTRKGASDQPYSSSSLTTVGSGPHSTSLFRLLHIEKALNGRLPQSCQDAVSLHGGPSSFKNCVDSGDIRNSSSDVDSD